MRRGETGAPVVYYGQTTKAETDAGTGEEVERQIRFLKSYTVFNVGQIDGLPERIASADGFFAATRRRARRTG